MGWPLPCVPVGAWWRSACRTGPLQGLQRLFSNLPRDFLKQSFDAQEQEHTPPRLGAASVKVRDEQESPAHCNQIFGEGNRKIRKPLFLGECPSQTVPLESSTKSAQGSQDGPEQQRLPGRDENRSPRKASGNQAKHQCRRRSSIGNPGKLIANEFSGRERGNGIGKPGCAQKFQRRAVQVQPSPARSPT